MTSDWDPYENIPETTRRGVEYIKAQKDAEKPFFLYFAYPSPHAPIIPNDKFDGKSKAGPFGDFVYETDDSIGQLLKALEDSGQADNTIIIFSADNGPEHYAWERDEKFDHWSAHPLRGLKRDIYDGGHRVPTIIKWPGVTKPGTVNGALVSQIDFMATLASSLGHELPVDAAEDSHDLLPLLKGETGSIRTTHIHNTKPDHFAIRHGKWLLINAETGYLRNPPASWDKKHGMPADDKTPVELYDLENDLGQKHNVAAEHPERVTELQALLKKIREQGYSAPRLEK
jgi:arylsulfatase A